ncbi:hypothetical protein HKD37_13G035329 [Glycine soja]|nr:hypothetical protein GmHk_13G036080 [Glycine max]
MRTLTWRLNPEVKEILTFIHSQHGPRLPSCERDKRETLGWNIHDMKGLDPTLYIYKINTKEGSLPKWSSQEKLIPNMMEVVKGEDAKPTIKIKAYHEGFQQVLTIMHPFDL